MTLQWVSAERQVKMRERFDDRYASALRHGNHLWVATVAHLINPPITDGATLDAENMAFEPAVGCYVCEQVFSDRLASRRCPGEPRR